MSENKRILWIDQLRGIAFYTVILGHMSIGKGLKNWIYSFHMPLFFMISGLNLNVEKISKTRFIDYFIRLSKKMLVPYLWLQMLSFVLRFVIALLKDKSVPVPKYLLGILVGNNNITGAPSNPLYYVLLLFLAQLGLWFVIRVSKGNKGIIGVILCAFSVVSLLLQKRDMTWHINVVPMAMLLIFMGRLLMDGYLAVKDKLHTLNKVIYLGICGMLLAGGYVLNRLNGRISIHGNYYGKSVVLFLACAVASTVAFALLVMLLPHSKLITFIGMNTFFYMGIHKPLLLVFETVVGEYENHPVFLVAGSLICFFGLAPVTRLFSSFMPYTCGNGIREKTTAVKIFKFIAVAAAGLVPWLYLTKDFISGSAFRWAASLAVFAVAVVITERFFTLCMPFMFMEEKSVRNKN